MHSLKGEPVEKWQLLQDHLNAVTAKASDFATVFDAQDWAWNAGLLHDLGKATNAFQQYLLEANEMDDPDYEPDDSSRNHASAGAAFAHDRLGLPGKLLSYIVAGHHAGLPDYYANETGNAALVKRLDEGRRNLETIRPKIAKFTGRLRNLDRLPSRVNPPNLHLWIRMIFSCLVDADRLDTEAFCNPDRAAQRPVFPTLGTLAPCFFQSLKKLEADARATDVNRLRAEIRRACEKAAEGSPGLFSLSVPTGGGKTLSAMAFALRHALRYGKHRIIYVIPYTSIIEQTAKTLGDIFGRENIIEHHSNLAPSDNKKETLRSELAAENWDAPVVITTNVQFFESLYSAKTGRTRKLHNIVNSVVILDEAQMIPPELLTPCVDVINQLVDNFGVSFVMATATQPALPGLQPSEIIPKNLKLYERLQRTQIHFPANMAEQVTWPEIAVRLCRHDRVLCIVNTRRDCYDLFKLMPEGTIHLSALMCGAHRSEVIEEIKKRLRTGKPCRVISTQLVEAGVDLDFPVVYRALAGLDSIAQAAGRCNREGDLNSEGRLGEVQVFIPPKSAPPGLLRKGEDKTREMLSIEGFDPQNPEWYSKYFELFYSSVNDTGSRFAQLLVRDVPNIAFRTAGNEFKIIDDANQERVFIRWGENGKWLDELRRIGPTRENLRSLQRNTVGLSKYLFSLARERGDIEEIQKGFWLWIGKYSTMTGVDAFGEGFSIEEFDQ